MRNVEFERPAINPVEGGYTGASGFNGIFEDDGIFGPNVSPFDPYDDLVLTYTESPDGETVTVPIENHLTRNLTGADSADLDEAAGTCIELFARWLAYRDVTITEPQGTAVDGTTGVTISYIRRQPYLVIRLKKICPC